MFVDLRNNRIGFHLIKYGIWESDTVNWLREFLCEGMKVLDIGANIGYFSCYEARIVGNSGKVYAIEPDPRNLELLRKNIQINDLYNVEVFDCVISNRTGIENFYLSKTSSHNSLIPISKTYGEIKVKAYTVDDFLKEKGIHSVDAIRMDVEGAEGKVIDGASSTLEKTKVLFVEIHPQLVRMTGYSVKWIMDKLKSLGFELERKGKNHVFLKKK
jgi:FkbM family methyltransferase